MERQWEFRYALPRPPEGGLVELSAEEAKGDPKEALWELGRFYAGTKQHEKALNCLRQIMARLPDAERKAACVLAMGQTMEQVQDYESAIRYYREALSLEPVRSETWYFINNTGLGYSEFLVWSVQGDLATYYTDLRWPGWQDEMGTVPGDQALNIVERGTNPSA